MGTFNLLEECRELWGLDPKSHNTRRWVHVSTDEVYGTLGPHDPPFHEQSPYLPNSPYSATKAASDHLARSYHQTFGMNVIITHASNNFGPHQHAEKLIPTVIRRALTHEPIPVYGQGENIRDWLYVDDHCEGLDLAIRRGKAGETYNFGGEHELKNLDLVHQICDILNEIHNQGPSGNYRNLIQFVTDRPGHDFRYAVNTAKAQRDLGWKPSKSFEQKLKETVQWYLNRHLKKEHR